MQLVSNKNTKNKIATALGIVVSSAVALYSLWLLIVGQELITVLEGSPNQTITLYPTPFAAFFLLCAAIVIFGLGWKKPPLAILGAILMLLFSILGIFGLGGWFVVPSVILLVLTVFNQANS